MKTSLLYLLALLLILSGCQCDTDPAPEQTYLLQRKLSDITFPQGGGTVFDLTYSYNDQDQLIRVGGHIIRDTLLVAENFTLAYDTKGRVAHVQKWPSHDWYFTYNDQDQLVKQVKTYKDEDGSVSQYSYLHTYNTANQLEGVKVYSWQQNADVLVNIRKYTYTAGNHITVNYYSPTGILVRKQDAVTDDKKLPAYVLPLNSIPIFFFSEVFGEGIMTDHNITALTMLNGVEQTLYGGSYQAEYTYNKAGYPVTCVKKYEAGSVEKIEYIYKIK